MLLVENLSAKGLNIYMERNSYIKRNDKIYFSLIVYLFTIIYLLNSLAIIFYPLSLR